MSADSRGARLLRDGGILLLLAGAAWLGPAVAAHRARPAVLDFGPNDADYVRGFRADWERDGLTRFRWTTPLAEVHLPILARGEAFLLSLRARRHFIEPARVKLMTEGRTAASFEIAADPKVAYRILRLPLAHLEGRHPFTLTIESHSENPRPLGLALDWLELARSGPGSLFVLPLSMRWSLVLWSLVAFAAPRLLGAPRIAAALHAALVPCAATLGTGWDVIAAERIVRVGLTAYVAVALLAVALLAGKRARAALCVPSGEVAGALAILVLLALGVRLVCLLHPGFYYPDVTIHGLFALELAKSGLPAFLRDFTVNQYRHSLGLQMVGGHWYAFPYPPAFYLLCWPALRLAHYRPDAAVEVVAAGINSLEALLVFGLARRLRGSPALGLASAAAVPLLPIFLARLTLAYYPATVGHAVDTVLLLVLAAQLARLDRARVVLALAGLVALALLTYTQSLLNLGILLPLFLVLGISRDRTGEAWRRYAGLAVGGALGLAFAMGAFYGRYVPIFLDMRKGVPMAEERVLIEKLAREKAAGAAVVAEEEQDPLMGPGVDPLRGLEKAGWRVYVFYGPFAPLVLLGVLLLARRLEGDRARLVVAWALTYVLLNLASGGLPGPNLVRYHKDVLLAAPLFCVGLATLGAWLWERGRAGRVVAATYALSFVCFGAGRAVHYLTEKFVLER